ncbi:MAG: hypothetical protein AAFX02_02050 [Pseudomonadota bacterium]
MRAEDLARLRSGQTGDLTDLLDLMGIDLSESQRGQLDLIARLQTAVQDQGRPQSRRRRPAPESEKAIESLKTINEGLQAHSEMIACALGACPDCWGADPDCTECAGQGQPGFFLPDMVCFQTFVIPAIRRVLAEQATDYGKKSKEKGVDDYERTE